MITNRICNSTICGIALVTSTLLATGCHSISPAKAIVGHWTVDTNQTLNSSSTPSNLMGADFLKLVTLDFTSDGRFKMMNLISGTYTLKGFNVTLHPNYHVKVRPGIDPAQQDMHATLSSNGETLTATDKGQSMVFVKSAGK